MLQGQYFFCILILKLQPSILYFSDRLTFLGSPLCFRISTASIRPEPLVLVVNLLMSGSSIRASLAMLQHPLHHFQKQQQTRLQEPSVLLPAQVLPHLIQQQIILFPEVQIVHLSHYLDECLVVQKALVISNVDVFGVVQSLHTFFILLIQSCFIGLMCFRVLFLRLVLFGVIEDYFVFLEHIGQVDRWRCGIWSEHLDTAGPGLVIVLFIVYGILDFAL